MASQAESFEHWLVMHFIKYVFWIMFYPPKKLWIAALIKIFFLKC